MLTEHEREVNLLIPKATKIADAQLRKMGIKNESSLEAMDLWNRFYHKTMDKLAFEKGLRVI